MAAAARAPGRIVLAEGADPRVLDAAVSAARRRIADITLLGCGTAVPALLRQRGIRDEITVIDPALDRRLESYIEHYREIRGGRLSAPDEARAAISAPLGFAAMMVRRGDADGTVAGAVSTTADTIRAALTIIGKAADARMVSSFFLMSSADSDGSFGGPVLFADCALVVDPDEHELADIAVNSARSASAFIDEAPRVAMLSFSTAGSASHPRAETVRKAADMARRRWPELEIDGEIQFDAAVDAAVRARKAPGSRLRGMPNVFVFPGLDAANIGYKIAQRIGGMTAVGPVLQGLAKPANDLSRGCSADDILSLIAVTSVQAAAKAGSFPDGGRADPG